MDQEATLSSQRDTPRALDHLIINFSFKTVIVDKGSLYSFYLKTGPNQVVFSPSPHSLVEIIRTAKKHSTHNPKGAGPNITLHTNTRARMHTHQRTHTHRHTRLYLLLSTKSSDDSWACTCCFVKSSL